MKKYKGAGWRIVSKDGNPTEKGYYSVVLLHPAVNPTPGKDNSGIPTVATITDRLYDDLESNVENVRMDDEPETGLAWFEEYDSWYGEKVYAWAPDIEDVDCELPGGINWAEDEE